MNRCLLALALLATTGQALAAAEIKYGTADDLPVRQTELSLPASPPAEAEIDILVENPQREFLWKHFFNIKGELSFANITTKEWQPHAAQFHRALVTKAKALGLPYEALDRGISAALSSPANEKMAVIPVGAYLLRDSGKPAWAIVCNWEYAGPTYNAELPVRNGQPSQEAKKREPIWLSLEHRRVFVYSVETGEWLAYTSCD